MTLSSAFIVLLNAISLALVQANPMNDPHNHQGPDPMTWGLSTGEPLEGRHGEVERFYPFTQQGYYDENYRYWQPRPGRDASSTQNAESRTPNEVSTSTPNEKEVIEDSDDEGDLSYAILESIHVSKNTTKASASSIKPRKKKCKHLQRKRRSHLEDMGWFDRASEEIQRELIDSMILLWNYDQSIVDVREKVANRIRLQINSEMARILLDPDTDEVVFQDIARSTNRTYTDPAKAQVIEVLKANHLPEYKAKNEASYAFGEGGMKGHTAQEVVDFIWDRLTQ